MKRIVVCSDGTWQDLAQPYPTNVVKMAQAIKSTDDNGVQQIIYYDEGLGTKQIDNGRSFIDRLTKLGGGSIGLGIDRKIQNAYKFLCLNYEPDDEIYLFGFSRGAYTVRCLAGLIYNSGLPRREHIRKVPEAYEIYRDRNNNEKAPKGQIAKDFRNKYGDRAPIAALCCWDTVSSIGLLNNILNILNINNKEKLDRYSFHDNRVNETIKKAFHAVAIDENQKLFYFTPMEPESEDKPEQVSQVWFPGGHGSIGGGSSYDKGLSDIALEWMLEKVNSLGLSVSYGEFDVRPEYDTPFKLKKPLPFNFRTREFPKTIDFSDLHPSVIQRWKNRKCNYRPKNLEDRFGVYLDMS